MKNVLLIGLGVVGLAFGAREVVQFCCAVPSRAAEQTAQGVTSVFKVEGMTCSGCEASVRMAVGRLEGVREVQASYPKGEAAVIYDPDTVTAEQISQAIEKLGYTAEFITTEQPAGK